MARLKDEDFKTWVEAFEDAFVDSETFGRLAQIASDGKTLDLIAGNGPLENLIPAVIRKADDGGWLKNLLDEALAMQPDRLKLRAVKADFETLMFIEPDSPFDATLILGAAMLDRAGLRARLRALQSDAVAPVLLVCGEPYSGKTWSTRLISYVASKKSDLNLAVVDMEPSGGKIVDAALLGRLIAEECDYKRRPAANEEQASAMEPTVPHLAREECAARRDVVDRHRSPGEGHTLPEREGFSVRPRAGDSDQSADGAPYHPELPRT